MKKFNYLVASFLLSLAWCMIAQAIKPVFRILNDTDYPLKASIVGATFGKYQESLTSKTIEPGSIDSIYSHEPRPATALLLVINYMGTQRMLRIESPTEKELEEGFTGNLTYAVRGTQRGVYAFPIITYRHFIEY